ncbi:hypothetical protein L249_0902 [Ophiocordyceps polyrhachis-furcata BCC 54312]|uniref:Alkyl hydroperoxide reductase subunit C/ Thiol specific antioxidant domain-containing protein n=1 Tax=Ophiocordyceps polyrhachis-furcata BCC 54312 TaxID=1330021 RepID=A0A367LCQ1_9HYPO|nr:hypothetical protein L249_0902 [Ophiocordyceps polyrhachis-furcata BCC 54312]
MLSSLTTKIALRNVGLKSDSFDFFGGAAAAAAAAATEEPSRQKLTNGNDTADAQDDEAARWPAWMSLKSLPLTVHPWITPPPPPIPVARLPQVGSVAPRDRDNKLDLGGGRRVLVVFLRCAGCAFAQKTFLNLRTLANRHSQSLTCIAVSHSSPSATRKWIDLLGGAWNVRIVIDQDRAIYAAWGLGLASYWQLFNPTTQIQGWREKGWLGDRVADAVQRKRDNYYTEAPVFTSKNRVNSSSSITTTTTSSKSFASKFRTSKSRDRPDSAPAPASAPPVDDDPTNVLGNKWQEAGAFAVDGRGTILWAVKAENASDILDLDEGVRVLCL